jgi:hypothetical protein
MTPYEEYIKDLSLGEERSAAWGPADYFKCGNFTREIIVYAHHEIGWLSHIFNVYEAFTLLAQHLGTALQDEAVWDQLIISRPSALEILSAKGRLDASSSNRPLIANLLSSRNREVRHSALAIIATQLDHQFSRSMIAWLMAIDQSVIDL